MDDNKLQLIASTGSIPAGKTQCVTVDGQEILLCHSKEGWYAIDNMCSHAKARLSEGKLKGCKVLCPLHGAAFDIRDGAALSKPASIPLKTYPLKITGDDIFIVL
ncbi:3-phenylpropionate/cinnamic acid dioxygenase ferredoxin subunit [Sinobacterium norvegicum]|uniref:3-phenylpropionate/cinnamic acid dioxygenase ferredoxin subunit n=1 Tax=Sinobacterium norvegicum TaxID=1641715 RepID=A0ABN8EF36_9GAMM|nr:non-heme iron oxygenase ferredoxin subunit [Sinobacterium norvegicum]CAH0991008.1 3-phenylpropionate/cinnamic acid dioxygenase ferredoxin subunit [Sinobacterium norvegicum]